MNFDKLVADLQVWYKAQCDGDWEHEYGVSINTLDNPGWSVKIDLCQTLLENKAFKEIVSDDEEDWIECRVVNNQFVGYAAPHGLGQILGIFLEWARTEKDWLAIPTPPTQKSLDDEFLSNLGDEIGPEICRRSGCKRKRILYSIFCKTHHFEMIKGYLPPE